MHKFKITQLLLLFLFISGISLAQVGTRAADFNLKNTDGKSVKLSDFKGKIVILDFWATWCPPCRKGIPDLISLQKEYAGKVQVVGISVDTETKADVAGFIKSYGINYPILYFTDEVIKAYGGIEGIPTAFVINRNGEIVDKHVGLVRKTVYTELIDKLLAAAPPVTKVNKAKK